MRTNFHERLDALIADLAEMCHLAGVAMDRATHALLQADLVAAERVVSDHDQLITMKARNEETAFVLLALQAPVAGDLRAIVSSLQNVADAERMGGLALHVAKIARLRHPARALPAEALGSFTEMGRLAVEMADRAHQVVKNGDPRRAAEIRQDDAAMDTLHRELFTLMADRDWQHGVPAAVDVTLLGRFYERFADHCVDIGRRVVFQITGSTATAG